MDFKYDKVSGEIAVSTNDKLQGSTTASKILTTINEELKHDSTGDIDLQGISCDDAMAALGIANSALWTIAGVALPAAAGATSAMGFVTGAVISIGGTAC